MDKTLLRLRELVNTLKAPVLFESINKTEYNDFVKIDVEKGEMLVKCLVEEDGFIITKSIFKDNCLLQTHTHSQCEYVIVLEGYIVIVVHEKIFTYNKGDLFKIDKEVPHAIIEGNGVILWVVIK